MIGENKMKKALAIILSICFVLCLTACNRDETTSDVASDNSQFTSAQTQTNTSDEASNHPETNNPNNSKVPNGSSNPSGSNGSGNNTSSGTKNSNGTTSSSNANDTNSSNSLSNSNGTNGTNNSGAPTHTHSYSNATCTQPKKCSCGATSGSALGHKWQDATCKAPKTCSVCKITEGNKAEHVLEGTTCKWCKQVVVVSPTLLKNRNYEFYKLIDYPFEEEGLSGTIALYTASVDFSGNREPIYFDGMYHEGELNPNYPAEAPQPIFYKNKYYFPNTNLGPFDSQKSISGNRIVLTFTEHNAQMKIEFELLSNDTLKVVSMKNISQTDPCKFNFSVGDIFE